MKISKTCISTQNRKIKIIMLSIVLGLMAFSVKAQPQETLSSQLKECHYLDNVEATSGYGKNFNWQSLAKYSALVKAEALGASHVVWVRFETVGAFNGIAIAYNCQS